MGYHAIGLNRTLPKPVLRHGFKRTINNPGPVTTAFANQDTHRAAMRFTLRHLLYVIAVFAASLASGYPGSLLLPNEVWKVVSIHEEEGYGGDWHGHEMHPAPLGTIGKDYIATIRSGLRTQTINLGDSFVISEHQLQLPDVGSYIVLEATSTDTHGTLPVTSVEPTSNVRIALAATFSLLCSIALVAGCSSIRWIARRQAFLYRERRMIDRSLRQTSRHVNQPDGEPTG